MRVVQLNRDLVGQQIPIRVVGAKTADDVVHRAGAQEIFLQEAQFLADRSGVVRVKHPGDRFGRQRLGDRADEIAVAELVEVEGIRRARGPEPQRVDGLAAIADHRPVKWNSQQRRRFARPPEPEIRR